MEAMQRYRLRTFPCDTADMTRNTISILFPIRKKCHFIPLHSPDSSDSLIFFFIPKLHSGTRVLKETSAKVLLAARKPEACQHRRCHGDGQGALKRAP